MKNIYAFFILSTFLLINNLGFGQTYSPLNGTTDVSSKPTLSITFTSGDNVVINSGYTIYVAHTDLSNPIALSTGGNGFPPDSQDSRLDISNHVFTIDLSSTLLDYSTEYLVWIPTGALSVNGSNFSDLNDYQNPNWTFTTESEPPASYTLTPLNSALGISVTPNLSITFNSGDNLILNSGYNIYVAHSDFSNPIALSTGGNGFPPDSQDSRLDITDHIFSIDLSSTQLDYESEYMIYIPTGALSVNGSNFSDLNDYQNPAWTFTTVAPPIPIINTYSPTQYAINVPINQSFQLTFDRDIQWATVAAEYKILLRSGGTTIEEYIISPGYVDSNLAIDGDQLTSDRLTITPYSDLNINTSYYITIPNGVIESIYGATFEGINNSETNNWRFTTVGVPIWADGYPFTENLTLANIDFVGQTDKEGTYNYIVSASTNMPTASQVKNGFDGDGAAGLISNSGSPGAMTADTDFGETLDISSLTAETTYYIYLVATSSAGSLDSEVIQIPFTTLERNPPVATFNPIDGANNVSILTNVVITFDEPVRMLDGTIIDNSNVASLITFLLNPANPVAFTATIDATKSIITISPDEPLNDNSGYDVTIVAVEDYYGNQQLSSSTTSFSTDSYVTWNGGNSSDWTANQNWDGNFNEGASVHILSTATNMPVIDGATTIQNILIDAGASLSITTNGDLTVNGDLTLNSSNDELIGNASLINNGNISVDNSNVHIHQSISNPNNTYYISSPVTGVTMNDIGCDWGMSYYNNPTDSYVWLQGSDYLNVGTGYELYSYSNLDFSGQINDANQYLIPLIRTEGKGFGWNLVGNPYPATLDWDLIDEAFKVNIVDGFWIYLNDQGIFGTYNTIGGGVNINNGELPSNHSCWIKVPSGTSGSITLPKSALVENSKTLLKSKSSNSVTRIKLSGVNNIYKDETVVAFSELSDDLEDGYDSEKMFSSSKNYFQLFSKESFNSLAINSKSELIEDIEVSIQLGYRAPYAGTFQIEVAELTNLPDNSILVLEDTYKNTNINLLLNNNYSFEVNQSGNNNDRFVLHVKKQISTSIDDQENDDILIYSDNNNITITGDNIAGKSFEIHSLDGKTIKNGYIKEEIKSVINVTHKGIVIVTIFDNQTSYTQKVLIE